MTNLGGGGISFNNCMLCITVTLILQLLNLVTLLMPCSFMENWNEVTVIRIGQNNTVSSVNYQKQLSMEDFCCMH